VTLDYTKESGGSALSVQQFSEVLDAQTVSLTRPLSLSASGSYSEDCIHIPVKDGLMGNAYSYLSKRNADELRSIIRNTSLVICHKLFRYHNQLIMQECRSSSIPYIIVPHGSLDPYVFTYRNTQKRAWFMLVGNKLFRDASAIIYATAQEMAKASHKVPSDRGIVIRWPVYEPKNLNRNRCRELIWSRYGIQRGTLMYLMLGRLHSSKRIIEAIRGFKAARLPNAVLLIAGPEDEYTAMQISSYAKSISISNVYIIGPVYGSDKEELLSACDFSLNASYRENYCYSIVEGMSYGTPAVLTPGNDLASTLEQEGCAIRCVDYSDNSLALAMRISSTMKDADTAAMRDKARDWVRNNATIGVFQHNLLHLVNNLLDHRVCTDTVR